uniref:Uncharacterized protein n=1 Tax=Eubacterium cellulosolvens (strain ATCC 43171 / JCM 9499 / 6) TaxID=633697 RepID=I5AQK3_EUBC6
MLDTFRDGMEIINSSQGNANERKASVEQAAQGLGLEDITKDSYSNLTAVTNAQAVYIRAKNKIREYGEQMKTEAGHIETLGNELQTLDENISAMVNKYFG